MWATLLEVEMGITFPSVCLQMIETRYMRQYGEMSPARRLQVFADLVRLFNHEIGPADFTKKWPEYR